MRYVSKEFLSSSPDEAGSIICTVTTRRIVDFSQYSVREGGFISGEVRIADCNDHVCLDFNATGQKGFNKRLEKLDKLIAELQTMRTQYEEMWYSHLRDVKFYNQREGFKDEAV